MHISISDTNDIPALVALLNSAYRGESSKKGWTTEADLLHGEFRTDDAALTEAITHPSASILKCTDNSGNIIGCVYLEKQERGLYLGMFAVDPEMQGGGIGKQILAAAEVHAIKQGSSAIFMSVISVRHELIAWYERHGYRKTGETKPFPADERYGIPTQQLEFVILEKQLLS